MKKFLSAFRCAPAIAALAAAAIGTGCTSGALDRPRTMPIPGDAEAKMAEAEGLVRRGHFTAFKKASALYKEIYFRPGRPAGVASRYVRSLILLRVRECQIGILFGPTAGEARRVIRENPGLRGLSPLVEMADMLSVGQPSAGIQTDINSVQVKHGVDDAGRLKSELKALAAGEDFYAYLYVSFFGVVAGWSSDRDGDLSAVYALFPDSPLMLYANAVRYTREKPDVLVRLAEADPEFFEAYFNLGGLDLAGRNLLSAEKNFLKALPGLGGSPQETIYLASIYTATEEFEKSLEFYDRTLELSPGYRDALLGKAICQGYLGRYDEAIATLQKMIELGNWLMGECHYWLAWNHHALKDLDSAQAHIEESKGRLPTNSEVFGLAGTIALEKTQYDRAEKEFQDALKYNAANTEALFGLGRINDQRGKWLDSAGYYERAAEQVGKSEAAIRNRIEQIKSAVLSEARRAAMLAKKESQLRGTRATLALACYNTAAALVNGGFQERAVPWAEKAAAHPQFRDQAAALLIKIKKQ
ncbi:MAG: tetratricopeptide repeat protein [Candidatus Aminicenantales bacterium]|jgi:tetratricopeptide (TPR) repeat protein